MAAPENLRFEEANGFVPRFVLLATGQQFHRLAAAADESPTLSLDFPALNTWLRCSLYLNGSTPFREIRRICPAPLFMAPVSLDRRAAIDAYIDLFRQAVSRIETGASIIALSGGCDSRHILLELHAQKRLPDLAVTVSLMSRPTEAKIASDLALRVGIRQIVVEPQPLQSIDDEVWKDHASDFMSLQHGWFACVGRNRDDKDWWDGIAGDVLSAGLFVEPWNLQLFRENRLDELADRLVMRGAVPYFRDQSLFPRDASLEEVRTELARHQHAPNPVGSFYFWNRTRVDIASSAFGVLRPANQRIHTPYLDRDLWAFLASLPAELLIDHQFHLDAVATAYPEFADVPYFHGKIKLGVRKQMPKVLPLLSYVLAQGSADRRHWLGNIARVARLVVDPKGIAAIDWSLQLIVYMTELSALAGRKRSRPVDRN